MTSSDSSAYAMQWRDLVLMIEGIIEKKKGSSDISSDSIVRMKKTAEQFVYLNNNKQMYNNEQQFSISCMGSLRP